MRRERAAGWALVIVAMFAALGLAAEGGRARAQEPAPTIVITQPTPTATPGGPPPTAPSEPPVEGEYIVKPGDTLFSAALEMGVNLDEMGCVVRPTFRPSEPLVIGDALAMMAPGTLCHAVAPGGESPAGIALTYGVSVRPLLAEAWNQLADDPMAMLEAGRWVRVPLAGSGLAREGGPGTTSGSPFVTWMLAQPANTPLDQALGSGGVRRPATMAPVPADWPYGTGNFTWPTYGFLTQGYRYDHRALDIAATWGEPVTAADRGVVIRAGWNFQGYGQFVVIDHNIDYLTLYAHLDTLFVEEGEVVAQGQVIGTVGTTGNSTGPHLHFEIRDFGRLTNPLELLGR